MNTLAYKIESSHPIIAKLPFDQIQNGSRLASRDLAVSLAAKSLTFPPGGEIRVVHVPTGEVVYCKTSDWGVLDV